MLAFRLRGPLTMAWQMSSMCMLPARETAAEARMTPATRGTEIGVERRSRDALDRRRGAAVVPTALRSALHEPPADIDVWGIPRPESSSSPTSDPTLADDVEVRIFRLRWGNDYAMIANPRRLIHFQLEVWEAELAQNAWTAPRRSASIVVEHLEGTGDLDASAVTDLVTFLRREGFLAAAQGRRPRQPSPRRSGRGRALGRLAGVRRRPCRLDWTGADRHVRWWYRDVLHPLFSRAGAILTAVMAVAGLGAFVVAQASGSTRSARPTLPSTP